MFAENKITIDDFNNICRFCLAIQQTDIPIKFNPIFKDNGSPVNRALLKMITACLGFDDISATDGLPQNICSSCIKQLLTCNSFRQACVTSDDYLKNILRINDETEKKEPDEDNYYEMSADVELIQSEIEAETYQVDDHHGNGEVATYYISEIAANQHSNRMELDHDYYIEATEMKVIAIDDDDDNKSFIIDTIASVEEPMAESLELPDDGDKKKSRNRLSDQNKDLCIICGSMQSHGNLRRHMETHLGEKRRQPFTCPHCDRKFINRPSFIAHVNKHNGIRPFQCKVCDKEFFGANLLRTHMYSHSTENKYACNDCDKVFRYPHYLSQHRRIHRANTVYSCEHCEYTNVYLHNYKNHLRKHTGQYRFKCDVCSKGFSRKLLYMKHKEKHTIKE